MKSVLLLLFILLGKISNGQFSYKMSGNISKEFNNGKVYLLIPIDNQTAYFKKDSIIVKNGSFFFGGKMDRPCYQARLNFSLKSKKYYYNFVLDSGANDLNLKTTGNLNLKNVSALSKSNIIKGKLDSIFSRALNDFKREYTTNFVNAEISASIEFLKKYPDDFFSLTSLYQKSLQGSFPSRDSLILQTLNVFNKDLQLSPLGLPLHCSNVI